MAAVPTWSEYIGGFGLKEMLLTLFIAGVIVLAREKGRIFRRKG